MNLIIDIGNTRAKLAIFQNNAVLKTVVCLKEDLGVTQKRLFEEFPEIENGILANVAEPEKDFETLFAELPGKKIKLSPKTKVPFQNAYNSPETLGLDRIALAAAAVSALPQKNVLVIDAGTCVTYDIITKKPQYLGGAISPGLNMRFRALNNFTARLPLLRRNTEANPKPLGKNTQESLHLGVTQGLVFEIDGFIEHFKQQYQDLTVILTGGDSDFLSKRLKNSIFAPENFLLIGLNCILEFNIYR